MRFVSNDLVFDLLVKFEIKQIVFDFNTSSQKFTYLILLSTDGRMYTVQVLEEKNQIDSMEFFSRTFKVEKNPEFSMCKIRQSGNSFKYNCKVYQITPIFQDYSIAAGLISEKCFVESLSQVKIGDSLNLLIKYLVNSEISEKLLPEIYRNKGNKLYKLKFISSNPENE